MASEHDGQPSPALPSEGQNSRFDGQILDPQWSDPLYLMMAALVARRRHLHAGAKGGELLDAMTLNRVDLALEVAKHERRRLEQFAEGTGGAANRLFCHMAVCVTLCGGLTAEEAGCAVTEEAAALGLAWPAGPGALAVILHRALPADDRGAAPVQPDIVAEAFVLDMLRDEGLSRHGQRDTVLRAARRNHARVAATLFHAFQSFAGDDQRTADLLDWIDALVSAGLSENPGWLFAIEGALPRQTTKLRESAARVTRQLYDQIRAATDAAPYFRGELARVASNLAIRLSELGRREEALEPAEEAVEIYRSLAKQNPDAFRPDLAVARQSGQPAQRAGTA